MDGGGGDRQVRLPQPTTVKNKQPAPTQITTEQILRESQALQADEFKAPKVTITDPEELAGTFLNELAEYISSEDTFCPQFLFFFIFPALILSAVFSHHSSLPLLLQNTV